MVSLLKVVRRARHFSAVLDSTLKKRFKKSNADNVPENSSQKEFSDVVASVTKEPIVIRKWEPKIPIVPVVEVPKSEVRTFLHRIFLGKIATSFSLDCASNSCEMLYIE